MRSMRGDKMNFRFHWSVFLFLVFWFVLFCIVFFFFFFFYYYYYFSFCFGCLNRIKWWIFLNYFITHIFYIYVAVVLMSNALLSNAKDGIIIILNMRKLFGTLFPIFVVLVQICSISLSIKDGWHIRIEVILYFYRQLWQMRHQKLVKDFNLKSLKDNDGKETIHVRFTLYIYRYGSGASKDM